ncbi:MAG: hypothetical protein J0I25_11970 [Sphingomonadales bacterium]|nr:hypothetical protein [Sphingomonadales bacterium]
MEQRPGSFMRVPFHYVHYGEREHIENFFRDGSIQIDTLRAYDVSTHGVEIGDDEEGVSYCTVTDEAVQKIWDQGKEISPHLESFFGPGCDGNFIRVTNLEYNYAIFCVSRFLHRNLCTNFKNTYDACIYIERPFPFFSELSKAFERSNLAEKVIFQHVRDIEYRSREIDLSEDVMECFIKEERYSHQGETRAIWSAGDNPPKFFRFKAPDAIRYCRPVLLEDMPDYAPGTDPKLAGAAVIKSINACTRENYLTR